MRNYTLIEIKCWQCGKLFTGHHNGKFCSKECSSRYHSNRRNDGNALVVAPCRKMTREEVEQEKQKNMSYAERQKAKTLAMMPKIGEDL